MILVNGEGNLLRQIPGPVESPPMQQQSTNPRGMHFYERLDEVESGSGLWSLIVVLFAKIYAITLTGGCRNDPSIL